MESHMKSSFTQMKLTNFFEPSTVLVWNVMPIYSVIVLCQKNAESGVCAGSRWRIEIPRRKC